MTEILGYVAVPAIAIICYFLAEGYKNFLEFKFPETFEDYFKFIPLLVGFLGIIIAVLTFYLIPGYLPSENLLDTIVLGIISGFASTGMHQVFKQLKG